MPHKPNLLVAPNGFGKSSIATAFSSMNTRRIELAEKDYHKEDKSLAPGLSITVNDKKLTADRTKNEIRQQFDVLVINSGLTPKAQKHFKGSVSSSLEVKPITICKIPEKADFTYGVTEFRNKFGRNGKILPNISDLLKDARILYAIQDADLSRFTQVRIQAALITVIEKINQQAGTTAVISQWIVENCINDLHSVALLNEIGSKLVQRGLANSEVDGFFSAYQIASIHSNNPEKFTAALEWLKYTSVKAHYKNLISNFKTSDWQWARVEEIKKELIIKFPKAHQLSNGQRDIVTLIVQLHKTLYEGSKKPLILVIDEVFDYLDDANLVAFQYYITSIIKTYKAHEQIIYPLILTHLDPGVFFDFCFNKHKIQINYLQAKPVGKSQNALRLIEARDNQEHLKDKLEKYWFHFHTDSCEVTDNEWLNTLPKDWRCSETFHAYTREQLCRYLNEKNYDSLAVCFAVRVAIEKQIYNLLGQKDQKDEFLTTKRTKNKMDFAVNTGIDIPESNFLLGLIYNTNLHWNQGRDYVSPLVSKLNHPTIKQLIANVEN